MCRIITTIRFKNLVRVNPLACKAFEERLTILVKDYFDKEKNIKGKNEILRKWYNLCRENYYIQREMIREYLKGEDIKGKDQSFQQYSRQIGSRIYPLFVNFINSFEYICEVLYRNSEKLSELMPEDEIYRSFSKYRKAFNTTKATNKENIKLLEKFWSMRNAMHRNNFAREKIEFEITDYETNGKVQYLVKAGEPLYTPEWGLDKITEVMSSIMIDIINNIPDLEVKSIKDII